jgi:hypothetical protein
MVAWAGPNSSIYVSKISGFVRQVTDLEKSKSTESQQAISELDRSDHRFIHD